MFAKQPKVTDRQQVYELHYLYGIRFAKLDEGSPKHIQREENRKVKQMMFSKSGAYVVQKAKNRIAGQVLTKGRHAAREVKE